MKTYSYPATFEPGDEAAIVVSFPDVPEAITQGDSLADARSMAADALGLALLSSLSLKHPLPCPSAPGAGQIMITADADLSAKIAVLEAFDSAGISRSELGHRLGMDQREIRRILDPYHATTLADLIKALAALGHRLVIGVEAA